MAKKTSGPVCYAIYLRCSTDDQKHGDYTTIDTQREVGTRHVSAQGGVFVKEYADEGKSGTTLSRPGWKVLLAEAQAGAFDTVCVTYMSRLGRGDAAIIAEYLLKEAGVSVVFVHEQYADDEAGFVSKSVDRLVDGMYVVQVRKHTKTKMREMFDRGLCAAMFPSATPKKRQGNLSEQGTAG